MPDNTSASPARAKAFMVEPTINGTPNRIELDTGSALSIIQDCLYHLQLSRLPLSPTSVVLKTYSGEHIKPLGVISVDVKYNGQHHNSKALVVETVGPLLFGCDWLQHNRIDWSHVHRLASSTASTQRRLDDLLEHYSAEHTSAKIETLLTLQRTTTSCRWSKVFQGPTTALHTSRHGGNGA